MLLVFTKDHVKWHKSSLHPAYFSRSLNSFFAKQCLIIENNSVLHSSTNPITDQYLANIEFMKGDIKRIICKLDCNKAHGHDMISIRILKMSENVDAIIEPLFKIFKNCLNVEHFQMTGRKETSYWFLKKAIHKTSKTIVQYLFFQYVARFSKGPYTITC